MIFFLELILGFVKATLTDLCGLFVCLSVCFCLFCLTKASLIELIEQYRVVFPILCFTKAGSSNFDENF